ncbi:MAG: hypothetical protein QXN55_01420 [Candidatus Nitrosotenuis sp.]
MLLSEIYSSRASISRKSISVTWPFNVEGEFHDDPKVNNLLQRYHLMAVMLRRGDQYRGPEVRLSGTRENLQQFAAKELKMSPSLFARKINSK